MAEIPDGKQLDHLDMHYQRFKDRSYYHRQFTNCDFHGADFNECMFDHCTFTNNNFLGTTFRRCHFDTVTFTGDWRSVEFEHCAFQDCQFVDADLANSLMDSPSLWNTAGIMMAGPVGVKGRTIWAYVYKGKTMFRVGCKTDSYNTMLQRIYRKYGTENKDYLDAMKLLYRWGKRRIVALKGQANAD